MSENDQRARERESECGAKRNCVNNGMVFKFRFVAFKRNCMVMMDKTNRPDKFRTQQIKQKCW